MTRQLTTRLTMVGVALWATLAVVVGAAPAHAAPAPAASAPECPVVGIQASAKAARAVFSGTVDAVEREARDDGQTGAFYTHTVTVTRVYQGRVATETVEVRTDRNLQQCSLGPLSVGSDYLFFVTGSSELWLASGVSGTRPADATAVAEVESLLGDGKPPVDPEPEQAEFTPVDTSEPRSVTRSAAPGAAMVIVGLLGLAVVGGLRRRR